jgi:hypothetical protein
MAARICLLVGASHGHVHAEAEPLRSSPRSLPHPPAGVVAARRVL